MWDPRHSALSRAESFSHPVGPASTQDKATPKRASTQPTPGLGALLGLFALTVDSQDPMARLHRVAAGVGLLPEVTRCELALAPSEAPELLQQCFAAPPSPKGHTVPDHWLHIELASTVEPGFARVLSLALHTCAQLYEQAHHTKALREQTQTDPLTGLWNRRGFEALFDQALARWKRQGERLALLAIDVDHFKSINDTLGHEAGDKALTALANAMRSACRPGDLLVRRSGDEFLVLLTGANAEGAAKVAQRIQKAMAHDKTMTRSSITLSIGISDSSMLRPHKADLPDQAPGQEMLRAADQALYRAKSAGRNTWVIHPSCR